MSDYWTDNNIEKPQQIVVCAACRFDHTGNGEFINVCGARHFDETMCVQLQAMGYMSRAPQAEQGFIDQFGDFLTREEAMQIVLKNGQPFDQERNVSKIDLYSEGLY